VRRRLARDVVFAERKVNLLGFVLNAASVEQSRTLILAEQAKDADCGIGSRPSAYGLQR
jgi:hypothetical protein